MKAFDQSDPQFRTNPFRWDMAPGNGPKGSTKHCAESSCTDWTREGKIYCSEHVDSMAYVSGLLGRLALHKRQREAVRVDAEAAGADEHVAKEILVQLRTHGPRTLVRLCLDLREDIDVIEAYAAALVASKAALYGRSNRGVTSVRLAG